MTTIVVPYPNFVNATTADADQVDANFTALIAHMQSDVVHVDGTNSFTSFPVLPATAASAARHPMRKTDVDAADLERLQYKGTAGTQRYWQAATVSAVFDGSGNYALSFPESFANTCTLVIATAATAVAIGSVSPTVAGCTLKGPVSTTVSVSYMALGT